MTTCFRWRRIAIITPFLSFLFSAGTLKLQADVLPPALTVNGVPWSGSGGYYSGILAWQGVLTTGAIYVSGGGATLSGSYWQEGHYLGGYDEAGDGTAVWNPNENWVEGSNAQFSLLGSYARGTFALAGYDVASVDGSGNHWPPFPAGVSSGAPVAGGPLAVWVNDREFYRFSTGDTDYYYSITMTGSRCMGKA